MKGYFLCLLVSFALIGFCVGIAGAIIMGVSDGNKCGDGCRADNCMTSPCTCGITCEDYAVKSDNSGNKTYLMGAALTGAGFGTFVLIISFLFKIGKYVHLFKKLVFKNVPIIVCTIIFGYYCDCLKQRIMRLMEKRRKIAISPS